MTWTKLGDEFSDEARDLTDAELRTHVEALIWSNRRGLDLHIPKRDLKRFAESPGAAEAADGLVVKGWWEDRSADWNIGLRFPEWQEERVVVDKRREDAAARKRRSRLHKAGDHSLCIPGGSCPHVTRDTTRDGTRDGTRRPGRDGTGPTVPTVPPKDQDQDQEQHDANSQNQRVHIVSETTADRAPHSPPDNSESPATGGNARAGEADGPADGNGHHAQSPDREPGSAGARLPARLYDSQAIAARQAAEARARREAAERAQAGTVMP